MKTVPSDEIKCMRREMSRGKWRITRRNKRRKKVQIVPREKKRLRREIAKEQHKFMREDDCGKNKVQLVLREILKCMREKTCKGKQCKIIGSK